MQKAKKKRTNWTPRGVMGPIGPDWEELDRHCTYVVRDSTIPVPWLQRICHKRRQWWGFLVYSTETSNLNSNIGERNVWMTFKEAYSWPPDGRSCKPPPFACESVMKAFGPELFLVNPWWWVRDAVVVCSLPSHQAILSQPSHHINDIPLKLLFHAWGSVLWLFINLTFQSKW